MEIDGRGPNQLSLAAVEADAATLTHARLGFHRAFPARSAKRVLHWAQVLSLAALSYGVCLAPLCDAALTFRIAHAAAFALFAAAILWRLIAAAQLTPLLSRLAEPERWPTYTILCPLYREAEVVPDLVGALDRIDYPQDALDIKLLVEADDLDTLASALAMEGAAHIQIVLVPPAAPRTKPKALNVGLTLARGEYGSCSMRRIGHTRSNCEQHSLRSRTTHFLPARRRPW